jgi:hypothetical protein
VKENIPPPASSLTSFTGGALCFTGGALCFGSSFFVTPNQLDFAGWDLCCRRLRPARDLLEHKIASLIVHSVPLPVHSRNISLAESSIGQFGAFPLGNLHQFLMQNS